MKKSKRRGLKYGEIVEAILEAIANGMIEGWQGYPRGFRLPVVLGYVIKYILEEKKKKISKKKIKQTVGDLERRKILFIKEENDQAYVYIKEKGRERVLRHSLRLLLDFKKKKKQWDGKWFLVFFDVPENQRLKRDYLRRLLKQLGFYQYQKSVYLYPFECEEEVALIKKIVEGAKYMSYVVAEKIENEQGAKIFFDLK